MADIQLIKEEIKNGSYENVFAKLYEDASLIPYQTKRYMDLLDNFAEIFPETDVELYSAPGRSEVLGNHTDHQRGEILAASINLDAIAVVAKTEDGCIYLVSGRDELIELRTDELDISDSEKGTTKALIRGCVAGCAQRGYKVGGFKACITSDVLIGAGLSSSAAFETLIVTILSHLYNEGQISSTQTAMIGQFAENQYFGKPCGLMDQMACASGNLVHVDFENPVNPKVEQVVFDMNKYGYSLCITDTKGSHADLTDEYAAVPVEMKQVAALLGKDDLCGTTLDCLVQNASNIREKCGDRALLRAIHFVEENERVKSGVKALAQEEIETFLKIIESSGNSSYKYLQNVYTTKDVAHQNVSVALAFSDSYLQGIKGVCRVHGGGFAGTIQAFVKNENVKEYQTLMNSVFGENACKILKIRTLGGVKVVR